MLPLIDTHAHIFTEEFDHDRNDVVARSLAAGVQRVLLPNLDELSISAVMELVEQYPDVCYPMLGLHPSYVGPDYRNKLNAIEAALQELHSRCIAIGEIGLDYYWSTDHKAEMNDALRIQLQWALRYHLPVSLHARDAIHDTVQAIREVGPDELSGVFHSFTGSSDELHAILELPHFWVGINGVVTFKNCAFRSFLPELLPLDRLLIETDAPYLAPVPYRGKRNEPAYLTHILATISTLYEKKEATVREKLFENSCKLFNFTSREERPSA